MAGRQRLHWVDFAKAAAIILVVIYHVGGSGMDHLTGHYETAGSPFWEGINGVLTPIRMPLFFICAGLLAQAALARPWRAVWHPRFVILLWPYLLWSLLFAAVAACAYAPSNPRGYAVDQLLALPAGASPYWFLAALVVFFTVARVFGRSPTVILVASALVAALTPLLAPQVLEVVPDPVDQTVLRYGRNAFWYFLGCFGAGIVGRLVALSPPLLALVGGAAYGGIAAFARLADRGAELNFVLSATGVAAAIGASVWAVRHQRVRDWSQYLAARTLPIYLVHPLLMSLTVLVVARLAGLRLDQGMATAVTPLLVALFTFVSVWLYDRTRETRASWVFTAPGGRAGQA